jgi:hypothetical protein
VQATMNSLMQITRSQHRYAGKDLGGISPGGFLVEALGMDRQADGQIHGATGVPLRRLHGWRDHLWKMDRGDPGITRLIKSGASID